jgi:carboxypeptidase D
VNGTQDLLDPSGDVLTDDFSNGVPEQNNTFLVGTFPSQLLTSSANGTANAARTLWHFAQVWFQTFPDYKPNDDRISIWTESYGGHYGPAFANFFREQNDKIANGSWRDAGETYTIHLDTLGIINGCIDTQVQEPSYPQMAFNNTYNIQAINRTVYEAAMTRFTEAGGVRDMIETCRALAAEGDPENQGNNATVNDACAAANDATWDIEGAYVEISGRNYYDIAAIDPDPFPPNYYIGYLNQPHVQAALGVPVNYTNPGGNAAYYAFQNTGDYPRGGYLEDLAALIDAGIKVALVFGDRDYACNWIGGEAVSLALNHTRSTAFADAGYANLTVNSTYVGGLVRQAGNFSFTRVFQAGHEVPAYQPETAYAIFRRALFNLDIATGSDDTASNASYATSGMSDTWAVKDVAPKSDRPVCYAYNPTATCTDEELDALADGSALVRDYIVINNYTASLFPDLAGGNGTTGNGTAGTSGGSSSSSSSSGATDNIGSFINGNWAWCLVVSAMVTLASSWL